MCFWELRHRLVRENEQGKMCALEKIEEANLFSAFCPEKRGIGGAISSSYDGSFAVVTSQRTPTIRDTELAWVGEGFLTRGEMNHGLAEILRKSAVARRSGREDTESDGQAFGLIGIKQGFWRSLQNVSKFPTQVVGILNAGIQALATSRRMHVGRISGEENTTVSIPINHANVRSPD